MGNRNDQHLCKFKARFYTQFLVHRGRYQVNGTAVPPQPTYQNITKHSLALFDVYGSRFFYAREAAVLTIFRGTNGIIGPFQDVGIRYM